MAYFVLALMLSVAALEAVADEAQHDFILRNGTVYDGSGGEPFRADVAIEKTAVELLGAATAAACPLPDAQLRRLLTVVKINNELERIADNAVNMAERILHLSKYPLVKPLIDLPRMLGLAHAMVSDAIGAYVARDARAARAVIRGLGASGRA